MVLASLVGVVLGLCWHLAAPGGATLALAWLGTPASGLFLVATSGPRRVRHLVAGGLAWALAALAGALVWQGQGMGVALCVPQCAVWSALWLVEACAARRTPGCVQALLPILLVTLPSSASFGWQTPTQVATGLLLGALAAGLAGGPGLRWVRAIEKAACTPSGAGLVAAGLATLAAAVWVAEMSDLDAPGRVVAGLGGVAAWRWVWHAGGPRVRR